MIYIKLTKDEIKFKNIVLITTSLIMFLIGLSFFFTKYISFANPNELFYVVMLICFGCEFINYILTRQITKMDSLYKSLAYLIASVSGLLYMNEASNEVLGYTLLGFSIMMLVIKLIKIETLRSELNYSIFINIFSMSLFILLCFLILTNLFVGISNEVLILGFFFTANGFLNLIENIGNVRFNRNYKKTSK